MDRISALMDGELGSEDSRREIARLRDDDGLRQGWETYHLIGDAMRGQDAGGRLSGDFSGRISRLLEDEPALLAPRRTDARRAVRRAVMPLAAAAAAAGMVGWLVLSGNSPVPEGGQVAGTGAQTAPVTAVPVSMPATTAAAPAPSGMILSGPPANVPSNGQNELYLIVHHGVSPSPVMHGLAPYMRGVSAPLDGAR